MLFLLFYNRYAAFCFPLCFCLLAFAALTQNDGSFGQDLPFLEIFLLSSPPEEVLAACTIFFFFSAARDDRPLAVLPPAVVQLKSPGR